MLLFFFYDGNECILCRAGNLCAIPCLFYEFQPKKEIEKESKETKHSHSAHECKLARWNYQIAWLQSKLMQGNKNRALAIECHAAISLPPYRICFFISFFVEKMQQQKSIFVLCILSSKLICLFCNIFSGCQIRIGWCVSVCRSPRAKRWLVFY